MLYGLFQRGQKHCGRMDLYFHAEYACLYKMVGNEPASVGIGRSANNKGKYDIYKLAVLAVSHNCQLVELFQKPAK
jgi:hypothetical protein